MAEGRTRVSVAFTGDAARHAGVEGRTVAVIDVVRATTCIVEALANGARWVKPCGSVREARQAAGTLAAADSAQGTVAARDSAKGDGAGRAGDALLCGERGGLPIEGFDLGNSPREFGADAVAGKRLFMKTTNGTAAFMAVAGAKRVLAAAFVNLRAAADQLAAAGDVLIACAGKEGAFALDDAVCAGHLVREIEERSRGPLALDDGAEAARDLAGGREPSADMLAATAAGRALAGVGLSADLAVCADVGRRSAVPEMHGGVLALRGG